MSGLPVIIEGKAGGEKRNRDECAVLAKKRLAEVSCWPSSFVLCCLGVGQVLNASSVVLRTVRRANDDWTRNTPGRLVSRS